MNDKTYVVAHFTLGQAKRLCEKMDTFYEFEQAICTFLNELYATGYEICLTREENNARRHTKNSGIL